MGTEWIWYTLIPFVGSITLYAAMGTWAYRRIRRQAARPTCATRGRMRPFVQVAFWGVYLLLSAFMLWDLTPVGGWTPLGLVSLLCGCSMVIFVAIARVRLRLVWIPPIPIRWRR